MAARRLIIVLVVLLAISVVASAIAPDRRSGRFPVGTETSTTTVEDEPEEPTGDLVEAEIAISAERPQVVRATVGERLSLSISAPRAIQIEIEDLGLIGNAAPNSPVVFDALLREPGRLPITDAVSGQVLGRVIVRSDGGSREGEGSRGAGEAPGGGRAPDDALLT